MKKPIVWSVAFATAVILSACPRPRPQVVVKNGKVYRPKTSEEYELYKRAKEARARGDLKGEEKAWRRLVRFYPKSEFLKEAQRRLGWFAYRRGEWRRAVRLLADNLPSPPKSREDYRLWMAYSISQLKLGSSSEALNSLNEIFPKLPREDRRKIIPFLIQKARQEGDVLTEVRWLSESYALTPGEQRKSIKARIDRLLPKLSYRQLESLYLHRREPLDYPYTRVGFRLAQYLCHFREYQKCGEILAQLAQDLPREAPLREKVRDIREKLSAIRRVNPRVIGVIYPETGRGRPVGKWVRNAIELAAREHPKIRVVWLDSATDPRRAASAVEELVFKHKAVAIVGPVLSKTSRSAALRAQQLGIPLLSISIREDLTSIGSYIFRNNMTLSRMGRAMAYLAVKHLGHRRLAVFYPKRTSGIIQASAFWKEAERLGAKIVGAESYPPNAKNFTDPAKRLVGKKFLQYRPLWSQLYRPIREEKSPLRRRRLLEKLLKQFPPVIDFDALFIPAENVVQVATIASSLAQQDVEVKLHYSYWEKQLQELYQRRNRLLHFVQLLGTNVWLNQKIFALEPRNVVGSIFCVRYFPDSKSKIVQLFISKYRRAYPQQTRNRPPVQISAYAYDTFKLAAHLAERKGVDSREEFVRRLLQVKNFPSVTGPLTVHPSGEIIAPIRYILAHRKQEFRLFHKTKRPFF